MEFFGLSKELMSVQELICQQLIQLITSQLIRQGLLPTTDFHSEIGVVEGPNGPIAGKARLNNEMDFGTTLFSRILELLFPPSVH